MILTMQKRMLFLFVAAAMFASCSDNNYEKTKSGLVYKIYSSGKGPVAKKGQVIKLHFTQKIKDSVLQETYTSVPGYAMVDSVGPVYNAAEIFPMLREGDSLVVVMLGDSIRRKMGQLPPFMTKDDKLMLHFKVLDIFNDAQAATNDRSNEFNKQKDKQTQAFQTYMAGKKNVQKTAVGTYVEIENPGDGPAVESGKLISVRYTGKLIPSEKVFESNMNTPGAPPIEFVIGQGGVIPGWEDGLTLFKKGGKGKLYIPSELAYGDQQGPGGMPHQPLMFDIEIVDVRDAPKEQPQQPFIPQRTPQSTDTGTRKN
ncbi:MAG TPA: FKBP-type peptidyl-prolyl cis-trans isomerase [Chitinophagaceae bacterium]